MALLIFGGKKKPLCPAADDPLSPLNLFLADVVIVLGLTEGELLSMDGSVCSVPIRLGLSFFDAMASSRLGSERACIFFAKKSGYAALLLSRDVKLPCSIYALSKIWS